MKKQLVIFCCVACTVAATSCRSHYQVTDIQRTRILVDQAYDATPDAQAAAFIKPYQHEVDSVMSPVVGSCARYMAAKRPESNLSNLLADILVWGGKMYNETPQMAVYNMGGIRAGFAEGKVNYGQVVDVAPFENKICFLTLTGEHLMELFAQIAARHGEGVSRGVELAIPNASYRVATLDYLAQGNDGLVAFKAAKDLVSPQEARNNVRFIIMDYFREQAKQGKAVDAQVEGRIVEE